MIVKTSGRLAIFILKHDGKYDILSIMEFRYVRIMMAVSYTGIGSNPSISGGKK